MTDPERSDRPTGLQRSRARRIAPLAHELEPDVELYDADQVVAESRIGQEEPLEGPESDENGSRAVATAGDDLRKLSEPYSARRPGGWPMVAMDEVSEVRHLPQPRSWRSADDPEMAALLDWQPPDVLEPDPLAAVVVLPPVAPGAQRPAALLAYFAALADDTDRTSYAAADAGADDLAATLVRVASWLRSVASLSEPS